MLDKRNSLNFILSLHILLTLVLAQEAKLVAGSNFVCALDSGKVYCIDLNEKINFHENKALPKKFETVSGLSDKVTEIDAGNRYVCVLDNNRVKCWPVVRESYIEPSPSPRFIARDINFPYPVSNISISDEIGYAISENQLYSFSPKFESKPSLEKVSQNEFLHNANNLVFRGNRICIESSTGIYCRGHNSYGDLGSAEFVVKRIPPSSSNIFECLVGTFISAGGGVDRCSASYSVPVPKPSLEKFVAVQGLPKSKIGSLVSSYDRSCVKSIPDNNVYCWGGNLQSTRCFDNLTVHDDSGNRLTPDLKNTFLHGNCAVRVESLDRFDRITLSSSVGCGIEKEKVWCWSNPKEVFFSAPENHEPIAIEKLPDRVRSFTLDDSYTGYALIDDTVWVVPVISNYTNRLRPPRPIAKLSKVGASSSIDLVGVNDVDQDLRTSLYAAIEGHDLEKIKQLIKAGSNLEHEDYTFGETPLIFAIKSNFYEAFRLLLESGANPNHIANSMDTNQLIFSLIKGELRVWPNQLSTEFFGGQGLSPLHYAIAVKDIRYVRDLLSIKVIVSSQNSMRFSPLHLAAWHGQVEAIKLLLEAGSVVDEKCVFDMTALHYASFRGHTEIINTLVAHGANPKVRMKSGIDPLMLAAAGGHFESVKYLLSLGLSPYLTDDEGQTAFNYAQTGKASRIGGNALEKLIEILAATEN